MLSAAIPARRGWHSAPYHENNALPPARSLGDLTLNHFPLEPILDELGVAKSPPTRSVRRTIVTHCRVTTNSCQLADNVAMRQTRTQPVPFESDYSLAGL